MLLFTNKRQELLTLLHTIPDPTPTLDMHFKFLFQTLRLAMVDILCPISPRYLQYRPKQSRIQISLKMILLHVIYQKHYYLQLHTPIHAFCITSKR